MQLYISTCAAMSTLAIWCRVVHSRDVRSRVFSRPVFKMLSFGFDRCIKVNSPLVNCLISDILLDAKPRFSQKLLQFM